MRDEQSVRNAVARELFEMHIEELMRDGAARTAYSKWEELQSQRSLTFLMRADRILHLIREEGTAPSGSEGVNDEGLLPCPFCGGDCACINYSDHRAAYFAAFCCGQLDCHVSYEAARTEWNRRSPVSSVTELSDEQCDAIAAGMLTADDSEFDAVPLTTYEAGFIPMRDRIKYRAAIRRALTSSTEKGVTK